VSFLFPRRAITTSLRNRSWPCFPTGSPSSKYVHCCVTFPYKSLYFECYATMPMLADAHISSLGYLWFSLLAKRPFAARREGRLRLFLQLFFHQRKRKYFGNIGSVSSAFFCVKGKDSSHNHPAISQALERSMLFSALIWFPCYQKHAWRYSLTIILSYNSALLIRTFFICLFSLFVWFFFPSAESLTA